MRIDGHKEMTAREHADPSLIHAGQLCTSGRGARLVPRHGGRRDPPALAGDACARGRGMEGRTDPSASHPSPCLARRLREGEGEPADER